MSKKEIDGQVERVRTKTVRASLKDWIFIDELAGKGIPMRKAVHKLVETYKKHKDLSNLDVPEEWGE